MKVKVCGIKSVEQLQQLQNIGVDYAGMIFYPGSKRYAGAISPQEAAKIRLLSIKKVGVFVNATAEIILKALDDFGLSAVQLHGDETAGFCRQLQEKTTVIKVFRLNGNEEVETRTAPFEKVCDYFLFDTHTEQFGGSGRAFDWTKLAASSLAKPFFLSGGIGPGDVEKLRNFSHPQWYAVDVNSRFETAPGEKNMEAVNQFVNRLKLQNE